MKRQQHKMKKLIFNVLRNKIHISHQQVYKPIFHGIKSQIKAHDNKSNRSSVTVKENINKVNIRRTQRHTLISLSPKFQP